MPGGKVQESDIPRPSSDPGRADSNSNMRTEPGMWSPKCVSMVFLGSAKAEELKGTYCQRPLSRRLIETRNTTGPSDASEAVLMVQMY